MNRETTKAKSFESFRDLVSVLNAMNVDDEMVPPSDCGRDQSDGDISLSNTTCDDAGEASSEICILVQSTNACDVSELVSENDILRHHRPGDASSIVCLAWLIFEKVRLFLVAIFINKLTWT